MASVGHGSRPREMADGPAFLQSLFEHASDGVVQLAPDGKVRWANAALCAMLGYSQRNLLGKPFAALVAEEDQDHAHQLERLLQGNQFGRRIEERLLDRKKTPHWVSVIAFPLDAGSSVGCFIDVVHDITEAKLAQSNFESVIEPIPVPIALIGTQGQIILANSRFEEFFGYARGEAPEQLIEILLPGILRPNPQDSGMNSSSRLESRIQPGHHQVKVRRRNGTEGLVEIEFNPLEYQGRHWLLLSISDSTADKPTVARLRQSEETFAKAFRESPTPMTLMRVRDERYLEVNDRYEQLTGFRRDEIIGRTPAEIGLWVYPEQRRELLNQLSDEGYVRDIECSFRMKDGSIRVALGSMVLLPIADEQVVLSTAIDITDYKVTLLELQRAQRRFRTIFADAPVGMAICSMRGKFLAVNAALCDLLGYSRSELLRKDIVSVTHPEDVADTLEHLRFMQRGQVPPGNFEKRAVRKDGDVRWHEVRRSLISDPRTGKPQYIVSQVIDITDRKRADLALRETEERFRTIANSAPVLVWMAGADQLCTYFNQPWLDFTGRSLEQELGNGWAEGVHPEDLATCLEQYSRSFDARVPFTLHYRLRRKDGEYRWLVDNGVPRFAPDGSFVGYIGSCIDETERRVAEEALRGISVKLIEAQEKERRHIARELHDDINQRIAMLAIELQQLENQHTLNASSRGKLNKLFNHAVEISNAVQAISHELHSSSLEHVGIVAAARSFCREFSHRQKVKVEFNSTDVPDSVPEDVALGLYRTMQEGLHNAAKHSGVAKFNVELHGRKGAIELEIRDAGAGFDPQAVSKREGLGLISIQERILPLNGSFSIVSAPRRGTKLFVRIPLKQSA